MPDIFAADVVFLPNFIEQGLMEDITDRIDALPFVDDLAPSHVEAGTLDGAKHVVPHTLDLSVLFFNKDLYEQAGLDPEAPPESLEEVAEQARTIREEIGGDLREHLVAVQRLAAGEEPDLSGREVGDNAAAAHYETPLGFCP